MSGFSIRSRLRTWSEGEYKVRVQYKVKVQYKIRVQFKGTNLTGGRAHSSSEFWEIVGL